MTGLSAENLDAAVRALQHVCRYDSMRLETYREKENLADRIHLARIGSAVALRFDDVGYFNRVYCTDETVFQRLPEIEEFYRGNRFGCELVGPPAADGDRNSRLISRRGWEPAHCYTWLYAPNPRALTPDRPGGFVIRSVEPSQQQQFLLTYLQAFEAEPDRIPAALLNMRHLFGRPELACLMAWHGGSPAGVGMTMHSQSASLFCAGAALPQFREKGCHTALLAARIQLAAERGCQPIYSWALQGGQSQTNMEKAGLAVVGTTPAWRLSPGHHR